jgi:hypothetical protein
MSLKNIKTTKRKKPRRSSRITKSAKSMVPVWDGWEEWDGQKFHRFKTSSQSWFYQTFKHTELHPHLFNWMLKNDYTKKDVQACKALPNWKLSTSVCINAKMLLDGMPDFNKKEDEYWQSLAGTMGEVRPVTVHMKKSIQEWIEEGSTLLKNKKVEEKKKADVYVPSIQERIREQASMASEDIDVWLDEFVTNKDGFDPKGFDFKRHFQQKGVTQAHARKIIKFYEGELEEFRDLLKIPTASQLSKMDEKDADWWEQLKEGYSHLSKKDVQKFISALESLVEACNYVIDTSKATRKPRKTKPKSADKLVEKLKFAKTNDKYKLASIVPTEIVGANELWVFNVKTRKIGKYIASNIDPQGMKRAGSGLSVKGTTIQGFHEENSIQKTLRKPDEQLKEFKGAGKVALRKFLDEIKTTDTKLNGRINLDTILLKVSG